MKRFARAIAMMVPASLAACGGGDAAKSPEATAGDWDLPASKRVFVADCSKEEPSTDAYCACAWETARGIYGDEGVRGRGKPSQDDLDKIHRKVAAACAGEFPPEVIERAYMTGCTNGKKDLEQSCACSWNELVGRMPPQELVAERARRTEHYEGMVRASENACRHLRPVR